MVPVVDDDIEDDIEDESQEEESAAMNTVNFLDRFHEDSFQWKLGTELMCWNEQRRGNIDDERYDAQKAEAQMLNSGELVDVVNSAHCILDLGGEHEMQRIVGSAKWMKFGKILIAEIKRSKEEYDNALNAAGAQYKVHEPTFLDSDKNNIARFIGHICFLFCNRLFYCS